MAESPYISTNMDRGTTVKLSLDRIAKYVPASFAWVDIPSDTSVDLTNPTAAAGITGVGNYTIHTYTNAPSGVTRDPLNVMIRRDLSSGNYVLYAFDGKKSYLKNGSESWEEATAEISTNVAIERGSVAPSSHDVLWLDTSNYNATTRTGYIDLKYYKSTGWVSIFSSDDLMYTDVYDATGKATDIYDYMDGKVTALQATILNFGNHVANSLTLFHLDSSKRSSYNTNLMTAAQIGVALNTHRTEFAQVVDDQIETNTGVGGNATDLSADNATMTNHLNNHITAADVANWNQKATATHNHPYTDNSVTIDATDITSGVFTLDQLPESVKERCYQLTSLDEFTSSKTDAERKGKYHNGNTFYLQSGSDYRWFRIIDQTKIGTSSAADGYVEFTNEEEPLTWDAITGKPTTLAGYSIDDEAYTKSEVDALLVTPLANYNSLKGSFDTVDGKIALNMSDVITLDSGETIINVGSIRSSVLSRYTYKFWVLTRNGSSYRIYETAAKVASNGKVEIPLGMSWVKKHFDSANSTYTNYFASTYATESANPKFSTLGAGINLAATSTSQTFKSDNMVYGTDSTVEFDYSSTNVAFKVSYTDLANGCVTIEDDASDNIAQVESDLQDAYDKWGYPADYEGDIPPKEIEGNSYTNIAVGSDSTSRFM